MINEPGLICLDYQDIKQFFTNGGYGYCAYLEDIEENCDNASGHYRMICGDPDSLKMLDSVVLSIRGNLSVDRVHECIESFRKYSSENVNVIFSLSEAGNGQAHAVIFGTAGKKEGI